MNESAPPPAAEILLEHGRFLRRLAVGLLGDPDAAEDVVQETVLTALRRPPRSPRLRTWLATVARRLALSRLRSEGRRRRREEEHAQRRAAETPAPVDGVERLELHRRVVDEVLALDEHERTVVLLRFFDGLTLEAAAARLGVPRATARTRQRRALERLRGRLDAAHRGDRRAWVLALLPLLGIRETPRMPPVARPIGPPRAAVLVLGAAIAMVLLVLVTVERGTRPGERQQKTGERTEDPTGAGTGAGGGGVTNAMPRGSRGAGGNQAEAVWVVEGRILAWPHDRPVAGAFLLVADDPDAYPPVITQRLRTDAFGRFRLGRGEGTRTLRIWARGAPDLVGKPVRVRHEDEGHTAVEIRLEPGATVHGRVFGPDDRPVEGATVHVWSHAFFSDEGNPEMCTLLTGTGGLFRTPALGSLATLHAEAPGFAMSALDTPHLSPGQDVELDLNLREAGTVAGRVEAPAGAPVTEARVMLPAIRARPLGDV